MRLELAHFPVKEIVFASSTSYRNGTLSLNKQELLELVLEDPRVTAADIELVRPGEDCRITWIMDIIEPRLKVEGPGCVFPGILGGVETVGSGRTHCLTGAVVAVVSQVPSTTTSGNFAPCTTTLDMSGPGAITVFCQKHIIALVMTVEPGAQDLDYHTTYQLAEMKLARRLAEATLGQQPVELELLDNSVEDPSLPGVVYVQGCLTEATAQHPNIALYGWPVREAMPIYVEPNEFFDGAVTVRALGMASHMPSTYEMCEHPLIRGMYREHGKLWNFRGCILQRTRFTTPIGKEITANQTAKLAKFMGARGMVTSWYRGGNAFIDTMLTVGACEQLGIKSVLVTYELAGPEGTDPPLLCMVPEAVSIVSTGSDNEPLTVPGVARVVGPEEIPWDFSPGSKVFNARGPMEFYQRGGLIMGGFDLWGAEKLTGAAF